MWSKSMLVKIVFVLMGLHCAQNFEISASTVQSLIGLNNVEDPYSRLEWDCTSNVTCTAKDSYCNDKKKCQCPSGYIFNAAMTACIKVVTAYGATCNETSQCIGRLSFGSICSNGICSCAEGYHYLHGRCKKSFGLKETCQTDDDCYGNADKESLSCKNKVCACSVGFYQREYRVCRRNGTVVGAECAIDLDCNFPNALCNKSTGCYVPGNKTTSKTGTKVNDGKIKSLLRCASNTDCGLVGSATCHLGSCICEYGFAFNVGMEKCVPELGEPCKSNDAVEIANSKCRDGRWSCEGATVTAPNNLVCRKVTTTYNTSCLYNEQCYVFGPDALCENKKCICNEESHYEENDMFCWGNKKFGEICQSDKDCYVKTYDGKLDCKQNPTNSTYKVCMCPNGTHVNTAETSCVTDKPTIGSPCSSMLDCKPLVNITCDKMKCTCVTFYFDLNGVCSKGIGGWCNANVECKTENSTCKSGRCSCNPGFVSPSPGKCIPVVPFGGECEHERQCSDGAHCLPPEVNQPDESTTVGSETLSSTCRCEKGYHYKYGKCFRTRVLDESCDSLGECYVESSTDSVNCLMGVCSCSFDTKQVNSTFCLNGGTSNYIISSWFIVTVFFAVVYPVTNLR